MNGLISDLQTLIRQPSLSAKKQGLVKCVDLVASIMNKAGRNAEVLNLDDESKMKATHEALLIVHLLRHK
jgi:hypothetical protein